MIEIKLSGGVYDGKVLEISEELFHSGYLDMLAPLPETIDLFDHHAPCNLEIERLTYKRLPLTPYVWRII